MAGEQRQPLLLKDEPVDNFISYDDDDLEAAAKLRRKRERIRACLWVSTGVFVIALIGIGLFFGTHSIKSFGHGNKKPSLLGKYRHAAVASDVTQCSKVGRDTLKAGGNAVDASIAALLCMGLTDPQSMGIGGGFFMTIYNSSTGQSMVIDARETAPLNSNETMFVNASSSRGCLAIGVPGEIKGYWTAHQKYGKLPWKSLFQPAIDMAMNGFKVPRSLQNAFTDFEADYPDFRTEFPEFSKRFINKDTNQLYREGELLKRPVLGQTLQVLSEEGEKAFYNGSLTDKILADMRDDTYSECIITKQDFLSYTAEETEAISVTLGDGTKLYAPSDPSGGPVLAFIINILDGYGMTEDYLKSDDKTILAYHRIVEAFKFAYAKRTHLADHRFVENVTGLVQNLTSRTYADLVRSMIWDNKTFGYEYYGPSYYDAEKTSTAHLSVLDEDGVAVSVTSTVNLRFGSKVIGSRTGIIFNDEMDDFSTPNKTNGFNIPPSPANFIKPGKRPLSSMCPAIFVDKEGVVKMVVGAAGGSRITTATALVSSLVLWFGKNIQDAIDYHRIHHQLLPPHISYETGISDTIIKGLQSMGHNTTEESPGSSIVQGIVRQGKIIYANSDYRKGGTTAGY